MANHFAGAVLLARHDRLWAPIYRMWIVGNTGYIHTCLGAFRLHVPRGVWIRRVNHIAPHCSYIVRIYRRFRSKILMTLTIIDQAAATGMSYLFRSTGSVVGITITQCVLQNLLKTWLTERIRGPNASYVVSYLS